MTALDSPRRGRERLPVSSSVPTSRRAGLWVLLAVALATFALEGLLSGFGPSHYNNYVWLADAWLHGRSWIHFPGDFVDAVPYHGRAYIVEAPVPAVLMLPFVALFGTNANQTLLTAVLAAVTAATAWALCARLGLPVWQTALLVAFYIASTDVLYCGVTGDVWLFAHISAVCFTTLCLYELLGARRGALVALYGLAAALSRYPLALALPVYAALLWRSPQRVATLRAAAALAAPVLALWVWYNFARWGTPLDAGYTIWYHVMDQHAAVDPATLSLANLPLQLHWFFIDPPLLLPEFPWIAPSRFGTALTFLSPGLLVALFAPWRVGATRWLCLLAVVTAIPALLYYDTGGQQLGTRHALDFEPFLFVLVALAVRNSAAWWRVALLVYSTAAGALALAIWLFVPDAIP